MRLPSVTYPGFVQRRISMTAITSHHARRLETCRWILTRPCMGYFRATATARPHAAWINLLVRPNHYLGAGHHHADSGMFHFSALGVDWFTQGPFSQSFAGKYYNLVQVDGESEAGEMPGQILGYNGAATYLGATLGANAAAASAT